MELFATLSNRLKFFSSWTMFIKIIEMVKFERLSKKIWIKGLKTTVLTKTTNDSILKKIENGITSLHSKTIEQSKFHNIYIYICTDNFILILGYNAGERLSAVTGSVQRSTVTSSNRAHSASRRISHQQRQQQQQPQLQQQPRIPLGSLRNSDEHGARANSAQDSCDNSNDSGLGFEDRHQHLANANVSRVYDMV